MRTLLLPVPLALLPAAAGPAAAEPVDVAVDVELVLAVDVSRSMTLRELEIQRRGYAVALRSDAVVEAILGTGLGRIALRYVEWAGAESQTVIVDWTLIDDRAAAAAFADRLTAAFVTSMRRTSISGAIDHATASFAGNGYAGLRRIIDISGDGPNNNGRPVTAARDAAVAQGITINGLPLMTREGMGTQWTLDDLDVYYRDCVAGGPAAFVIPVLDWADFAAAVRTKIVLELASVFPPPPVADARPVRPVQGYDCLIGEKIWRRLYDDWN